MTEVRPHCENHGETVQCLTNIKFLHNECVRDRKETEREIFDELRKKPSYVLMFWVLGILMTITGGLIGGNYSMLISINEKVDAIAKIQQYELGRAAKERIATQ